MSFTQIKPLIVLHQRNKDAQSEFRSCLSAQEQFERSRWFSRSGWMRLGYQLKNKRDPIIQSFRTPKGTKSFHAYHACDVEIRPAVWAKMLRACGQSVCKPSLPNRRRIYAALMAEGQTSLAKRLKYSIGSSIVGQRDRIHHAWLSQKTEVAAAEADTAMREYSVILEPIVETRRVRALQRKYVAKLLDLGIHTDTTSIEELKSLLTNAEQERESPSNSCCTGAVRG
jgi:hypothetical protein